MQFPVIQVDRFQTRMTSQSPAIHKSGQVRFQQRLLAFARLPTSARLAPRAIVVVPIAVVVVLVEVTHNI